MSQHDPVEEFFARERREVHDLPGGRDHWEGIVEESRRPVRRGWLPYLGAAAAAAIVVGGIAYGTTADRGNHASPATASHPVTATVTQTVTAPPTSSGQALTSNPPTGSSSSRPPGPLPVPATFAALSMSNGGDGHLFAMGSAKCGESAPQCVSVVGSDDDGATWTSRASFTTLTTTNRRTPDRGNQAIGIRFANTHVGYLFGSVVMRTTDGGRSWSSYDVGGQRVLSLETDGSTVWFVTAQACRHGVALDQRGCSDVAVWSAPVGSTHATKVRSLGLRHLTESAWVSLDGSDAYVSVSYADQSLQTLPLRVSGSPATLPRPKGCSATGGVWAWGTAKADGHLVALCTSATGNGRRYAVASSSDRGSTWTAAAPAPDLGTPGYAGVWLTAADATHLVAVTQGLTTSSGQADEPNALLTSGDAGRTWAAASVVEGAESWSWAGAAGGSLVYALAGSAGTYHVSTDGGATFTSRLFRQ